MMCDHSGRATGVLRLRDGHLVKVIVCEDCGADVVQLGSEPYAVQSREATEQDEAIRRKELDDRQDRRT
jgi:hypothetical protein